MTEHPCFPHTLWWFWGPLAPISLPVTIHGMRAVVLPGLCIS